jgi:diaminohydroxyphosphoribosylaminopyrimidine deaminase/5-amino-6-(5-phosphoribosylamino)uracil reductase
MPRRSVSRDHERYLRRCLELARRAEGATSPNPMVGAVVVRAGRIVAEAFHRRAGGPHAEAAALRRAGKASRGATLYVNLEPCCHHGRTPPCVDAILASGVRRVVACHLDPFPLVKGRGFAALRRAGIEVIAGPLRREATRLNERYLTCVTRGRPFVIVKAAMSLDGKIATSGGESRWISSAQSRRVAHRLRATCDAVMIGINTALADDPLLNVRAGATRRQPRRVVIDSRLRLDPRGRLLRARRGGARGAVLIYAGGRAPRTRAERLERLGATVVRVREGSDGRLDLGAVMRDLATRRISSVLIEGGGELIGSALESRLVDKVCCFIAPLIVGGRDAVGMAGGRGASRLRQALRLREMSARRIGPDLLVEAYVSGGRI